MSLVQTGGSNPRSVRTRAHDSDLRRGDSNIVRSSESGSSNQAITIIVKDDDDEVQVSSPRSIARARRSRGNHGARGPVVDGADLELRLGTSRTRPLSTHGPVLASSSERVAKGAEVKVSRSTTIDLTSGNDDDVELTTSGKRKLQQRTPEPPKDIKLTCMICMDSMKEETSTVCGHIFCRACILGAIKAQKKCPTCRRKLTNSNIHRIYLSSGSR